MNLYIDKENLISLMRQNTHELFADCIKAIKNQLDVSFNFKKEEMSKNELLMAFLKLTTSGVGQTKKEFLEGNVFPQRPLKSNSHTKFNSDQLSSFYLIDDERISLLIEKGAVLIGKPGDELTLFNQIFLLQNDYLFDKKLKIGSQDFNKWSDLIKFSTATTDVIFIDAYILVDNTLIASNLIEYLKSICSKSKTRINIVIYTNADRISLPFADLNTLVKNEIEKVTGIKPNFTLIKYRDQRGVKSFAEHDRTLCTNYYRVYSGDTFNYFKANGSKDTKGREIHYSSLANKEYHELSISLIRDLQTNIDAMSSDSVEGDKISNYLKFK